MHHGDMLTNGVSAVPDHADEYHIIMVDRTGRESELCRTSNRRMALELRDHLQDANTREVKAGKSIRLAFCVSHPDYENWVEWYNDERDEGE